MASKTPSATDQLKPLKLVIHGPPASGKTQVAQRLCRRYGAHYISVKTMIDETLDELRQNIITARELAPSKPQTDDELGEEEEVEDEEGENLNGDVDVEHYEEQIRDINALMSSSPNNKLPDDYVVRLMRTFLAKPWCQSHGYVLDGFPKTLQQAKELFGQAAEVPKDPGEGQAAAPPPEVPGEGGAMQMGELVGNASVNIMPDFVVSLQADDDFLCERIMRLPEKEIQGTHYDEPNMVRRLLEFRNSNTPDNTVLNFFDEADIHPILIDVTEEGGDLECILEYLYQAFGPPIPGVGLSDEEEAELRKKEEEQKKLKQEAYMIEKTLAEETARREYEDKMEKWAETLEMLQQEEEKIIAAECEPLRHYLMTYVFPTLTKGLSEVATVKPDDPVDFLAEYLFRENPEGKMFDPAYTRTGEELSAKFKDSVSPNV